MSATNVNPYIYFNGTAAKAIQLYESALGAKTETVMRFGDAPGMGDKSPEQKDRVMHAALRIGEGLVMLTDMPPDEPVAAGGNVEVALHFTDPEEMAKAFAALAAGGKVKVPPQDMFWGAKFGALTDAHGVHWMFNCPLATA